MVAAHQVHIPPRHQHKVPRRRQIRLVSCPLVAPRPAPLALAPVVLPRALRRPGRARAPFSPARHCRRKGGEGGAPPGEGGEGVYCGREVGDGGGVEGALVEPLAPQQRPHRVAQHRLPPRQQHPTPPRSPGPGIPCHKLQKVRPRPGGGTRVQVWGDCDDSDRDAGGVAGGRRRNSEKAVEGHRHGLAGQNPLLPRQRGQRERKTEKEGGREKEGEEREQDKNWD